MEYALSLLPFEERRLTAEASVNLRTNEYILLAETR